MILVATDKYKGTIPADRAAGIIADSFRKVMPAEEVKAIGVADGGEGTARVISEFLTMHPVTVTVRNAVGTPIDTTYYINSSGEVAVDSSAVLGLMLVDADARDVMHATSAPLGELIKLIITRHNPKRIYLGVGGTATCDGGAGMLKALGADLQGVDSDVTAATLCNVTAVDLSTMIELPEIIPLCDVDVPLIADDASGSAITFAPQKGLMPEDAGRLSAALRHWSKLIGSNAPFSGAGGGLVSGLLSRFPARYGADEVIRLSGIESLRPRLVITGEGCVDEQSVMGKITGRISALARKMGAKSIVIGGMVKYSSALAGAFDGVYSTMDMPGVDASLPPESRLRLTAELVARNLDPVHKQRSLN